MNNVGKSIWEDFKVSLVKNVKETNKKDLDAAWESNGNWTNFYKTNLFPKICQDLGLLYGNNEYLTVDSTFYKKSKHGYDIPIVLIESENDASTTENEVYKLSCMHAPLKVLFICLEWGEYVMKSFTEDFWEFIFKDFIEQGQFNGFFGIIIAEWLDNLKFYSLGYDETGKIVDANRVIVEIK